MKPIIAFAGGRSNRRKETDMENYTTMKNGDVIEKRIVESHYDGLKWAAEKKSGYNYSAARHFPTEMELYFVSPAECGFDNEADYFNIRDVTASC